LPSNEPDQQHVEALDRHDPAIAAALAILGFGLEGEP
jgi:hypothetical protein